MLIPERDSPCSVPPCACREQESLAKRVILTDAIDWSCDTSEPGSAPPLTYVGGLDISFVKGDAITACAGIVIVQLPSLEVGAHLLFGGPPCNLPTRLPQVVYEKFEMVELTLPYISGFLAFRFVDCMAYVWRIVTCVVIRWAAPGRRRTC